MAVKQHKGAKGACDKLFSKIVRSFGQCYKCMSKERLQCAHIVSRTYSATRTNFSNAIPLCAKCHYHYTKWPIEFARFVEKLGLPYDEMKELALAGVGKKFDWDEELERLKSYL